MKTIILVLFTLASASAFACAKGEVKQNSDLRILRGGADVDIETVNGIATKTTPVAGLTEDVMKVVRQTANYDICMRDDGQDGFTITSAKLVGPATFQ